MRRLFLLFLLSISRLAAQSAACPTREVTVDVRQRNASEPIAGLVPADFLISGRGVVAGPPQSIATRLPADIVVLIEDRTRGGFLAGAAALFVKSLMPEDRVSVMTYGVSTKRQLAWSRDEDKIRLAIEKGADGMHLQVARPFYGVVDALKLFGKPVPGRQRSIFMLGDNFDRGSQIRTEQLAANLIDERVILDLAIDPAPSRKIPRVNLPPPTLSNQTPGYIPPPVGEQSVEALAQSSGGVADKFLEASYLRDMRERLKGRLTLTYCVQGKQTDHGPSVELSPGAKQKYDDVELRTPGIDLKRQRDQ